MIGSGDFLHRILELLRSEPQDSWGDITILLPGRRAGRKLKEALKPEVPRGCWLPQITTLGEWSSERLGLQVPGKIELLVELQQVAEGLRLSHRLPEWGSFDRFQSWGTAALADFNAIDHHLLDARQAFRDLRNIKDIESWSFGAETLTPGQLRFLEQWNALLPLYTAFHSRLQAASISTMAHLMRQMAEEDGWLGRVEGEVWMAGANALTRMPAPPSSAARVRVIEISAALVMP